VNSTKNGGQHDHESSVGNRSGTRLEEVLLLVGLEGPVQVLAGTVNVSERFLVQQSSETVLGGNFFEDVLRAVNITFQCNNSRLQVLTIINMLWSLAVGVCS
jgi:hypothetical protein